MATDKNDKCRVESVHVPEDEWCKHTALWTSEEQRRKFQLVMAPGVDWKAKTLAFRNGGQERGVVGHIPGSLPPFTGDAPVRSSSRLTCVRSVLDFGHDHAPADDMADSDLQRLRGLFMATRPTLPSHAPCFLSHVTASVLASILAVHTFNQL